MIEKRTIPIPPHLTKRYRGNVLALGAELKANFSLADGKNIRWYSGFGDLKDVDAYGVYWDAIKRALRKEKKAPQIIVHDAHPQFLSTQLAHELRATRLERAELVSVQHHHAHVAAAALLAQCSGRRLVGMACDGTGWGHDGTFWGCECFGGRLSDLKRVGHLANFPLPGADKVVSEPWRVAVALLYVAYGKKIFDFGIPWIKKKRKKIELVLRLLERGVRAPLASSAGRLFDGVAALCGLCLEQGSEAEAPRMLEQKAKGIDMRIVRPYRVVIRQGNDGAELQVSPIVRGIVQDLQDKVPVEKIAARFHAAFSIGVSRLCEATARQEKAHDVVLAGGVFFNAIVTRTVSARLAQRGLNVHVPEAAGIGDGVISLGQAVMGYVLGSSGSH